VARQTGVDSSPHARAAGVIEENRFASGGPELRPQDLPDAKFKALVRFVKTAAPTAYSEVGRAAETVRASALDWTLVRVAKLNNKNATGQIKVGYYGHGIVGLSITRADMATFLLDQVANLTYLHQAPAISN